MFDNPSKVISKHSEGASFDRQNLHPRITIWDGFGIIFMTDSDRKYKLRPVRFPSFELEILFKWRVY